MYFGELHRTTSLQALETRINTTTQQKALCTKNNSTSSSVDSPDYWSVSVAEDLQGQPYIALICKDLPHPPFALSFAFETQAFFPCGRCGLGTALTKHVVPMPGTLPETFASLQIKRWTKVTPTTKLTGRDEFQCAQTQGLQEVLRCDDRRLSLFLWNRMKTCLHRQRSVQSGRHIRPLGQAGTYVARSETCTVQLYGKSTEPCTAILHDDQQNGCDHLKSDRLAVAFWDRFSTDGVSIRVICSPCTCTSSCGGFSTVRGNGYGMRWHVWRLPVQRNESWPRSAQWYCLACRR